MIEAIGWLIMVMCISIVPIFFGAVVVSIIREGKKLKDKKLKASAEGLLDYYKDLEEEEDDEKS